MYFNTPSALAIVPLTETPTHTYIKTQLHVGSSSLFLPLPHSLPVFPAIYFWIVAFLLVKTQTVVTETDMRTDKDKLQQKTSI